MRDGQYRARIYRIAPSNFQASHLPLLGQAKTYDLVAFLAQTNGWLRDTCSRLLHERHDPGSVALLTNMLNNSRIPAARVQALQRLDGMGALSEAVLLWWVAGPG